MGWIALIGLFITALSALITFLQNRHKSGRPLSDRQKKRLNHAIHKVNEFKAMAVSMGCKAEGEPGDDPDPADDEE